MRIRQGLIATTIALTALGASAANAATIFSETFDVASGFAGATIITGTGGDSATSDHWAVTDYTALNNGTNGWNFAGSAYYAEQANADFTPTGNGALLLNEPDGVATHLVGLTAGKEYNLSLLVWGDNRPGEAYSLSSSITGTTIAGPTTTNFATYYSTDGLPGTNAGTALSFNFTAVSGSETLWFGQGNLSAASPIIDNILVSSVPEPATWAMLLFGFGGIGFMLRNNKSRKGVAALA